MTGHPGDWDKETVKKRTAFEAYLAQGPGRTITETAKIVGMNVRNVYDFAKRFKWKERAEEWDKAGGTGEVPLATEMALGVGIGQNQSLAPYSGSEDAELDKAQIRKMIDQYRGIIERTLAKMDEEQSTVKSPEVLAKLTKEFRELVDLYHKLTTPAGAGKVKDKGKIAENLTLIMGKMTQEERIAILTGGGAGKVQHVPGGAGGDARGTEDADYSEVPQAPGQDGRGCEGVPGSVEGAEGGDAGQL